ncbi:MAG TPA: hypothetical protein VMZ51_06500 [Acidimicrobiales bacterium]|nr:hypothetical protein [Acidimicrobiales bacterium]
MGAVEDGAGAGGGAVDGVVAGAVGGDVASGVVVGTVLVEVVVVSGGAVVVVVVGSGFSWLIAEVPVARVATPDRTADANHTASSRKRRTSLLSPLAT